ncbi:universal stress protein [Nocardia rhizosphaerae]|uniref:Universal stress protein n=1 Tax=Nocardia rhizosphaerae TaxID=1691571 RepID=A0ABV8LDW3_9NOCA
MTADMDPAIAAAFAEAAERGAELVAVHAWSDLSEGGFAGSSYLELPIPDFGTGEEALLAERLAGWSERYPVVVRREIELYGPRERLAAWSRSASLLVVGGRGRGGFRGLLLGSTSNRLVQRAECPVLVAHPGDLARQGIWSRPNGRNGRLGDEVTRIRIER